MHACLTTLFVQHIDMHSLYSTKTYILTLTHMHARTHVYTHVHKHTHTHTLTQIVVRSELNVLVLSISAKVVLAPSSTTGSFHCLHTYSFSS